MSFNCLNNIITDNLAINIDISNNDAYLRITELDFSASPSIELVKGFPDFGSTTLRDWRISNDTSRLTFYAKKIGLDSKVLEITPDCEFMTKTGKLSNIVYIQIPFDNFYSDVSSKYYYDLNMKYIKYLIYYINN